MGLSEHLTADAVIDFEGDGAVILRHDARSLPLGDGSVDLIVTSPPYFALRSYRDDGEHYDGQLGAEDTPAEFVANLVDCMAEWVRVLKPSGSIFVNLGDKYAGSGGHNNSGISDKSTLAGNGHTAGVGKAGPNKIKATRRSAPDRYNQDSGGIPRKSRMLLPHRFAIACEDQLGLICRMDMVWSKPNGLPESVTDRVRASHEYWFHLTRSPRYFSGLDEIREPYQPSTPENWLGDPLGRVPGSVWDIPLEPLIVPDEVRDLYDLPDHFAAFPQEWPRRLILGWSPEGGTILDPFGGTGTVAGVARTLGRYGIHNDLSADYNRLAAWRIFESGHFTKSEQRMWADRQGQML